MRYFIHMVTGAGVVRDPDGAEFPDIAAARREAAQRARDLMADVLRSGRAAPSDWEAVVEDDTGQTAFILQFDELIARRSSDSPARPNAGEPLQDFAPVYVRAKATAAAAQGLQQEMRATLNEMRLQLRTAARQDVS